MNVRSCVCEAAVLFNADEELTLGPLKSEDAAKIGQQFAFSQLGDAVMGDSQAPTWMALHGEFKHKDETLTIEQARGTATDLAVVVRGRSDAAIDALAQLWKALSKNAGVGLRPVEEVGAITYGTIAVVELPAPFVSFFPAAKVLAESLSGRLAGSPVRPSGEPFFRFAIEIPAASNRRRVAHKLLVETRAKSDKANVFWTQSPLPSDQHFQMLEELVKSQR